jgi:hypothetical protein
VFIVVFLTFACLHHLNRPEVINMAGKIVMMPGSVERLWCNYECIWNIELNGAGTVFYGYTEGLLDDELDEEQGRYLKALVEKDIELLEKSGKELLEQVHCERTMDEEFIRRMIDRRFDGAARLSQRIRMALGESIGMHIPTDDFAARRILKSVFLYCRGANWKLKENWGQVDVSVGQWRGVEINAHGELTSLELSDNGLAGPVPPDLNQCVDLHTLVLNDNALTGKIPTLGDSVHLKELNLSGNKFKGPLPLAFGRLKERGCHVIIDKGFEVSSDFSEFTSVSVAEDEDVDLNFSSLDLAGEVPSLNGFEKLRCLDMHYNSLSGSIPSFSACPRLVLVNLWRNQLTGSIPSFVECKCLEILNLGCNQFKGKLPSFAGCRSLKELHLYNNLLSGEIPVFTKCPRLRELYLNANNFSGHMPSFAGCPELKYVDISSNQLNDAPVSNFDDPSTINRIGKGKKIKKFPPGCQVQT